MKICPHCGKSLNKEKLTLKIEKELIAKAKEQKLNISEFLEEKLKEKLEE